MDAVNQNTGPLSAELKMREAIDALYVRLANPNAEPTPKHVGLLESGIAAAVMLSWAARHGGLPEMQAEYNHVRLLLGAVGDWDKHTGSCLVRLESAYNAALMHAEDQSAKPCVVRHAKCPLVLVAVFNELADDCGAAHMRWMSAPHAVPRTRKECEVLAAAWNLLCGRPVATVVEV